MKCIGTFQSSRAEIETHFLNLTTHSLPPHTPLKGTKLLLYSNCGRLYQGIFKMLIGLVGGQAGNTPE